MLAYTCPFAHMQPSVLEAKGLKNQHSVDKLSHSITISSQLQNFKLRTEIQPTQDLVSCSGQQEVYNTDYNKKATQLKNIIHGTVSSPVVFETHPLVWDVVLSPLPLDHGKQ